MKLHIDLTVEVDEELQEEVHKVVEVGEVISQLMATEPKGKEDPLMDVAKLILGKSK
jgi:hypothetical protein